VFIIQAIGDCMALKYKTSLKKLAKDKHSSLFISAGSCDENHFDIAENRETPCPSNIEPYLNFAKMRKNIQS
jgi:hypothetical protein